MSLMKLILLLVCFLYPIYSIGYTVVLKNGKKVEGELFREDDKEVHLKDKTGLTVKFNKASLDLTAMQNINTDKPKSESQETSNSTVKPKSLADQAKEAQKKKTGKAKVLTIEDLEKMPELSVIGSLEDTDKAVSEKTTAKTNNEPKKSIPAADEQYWRERARKLRYEIENLQDRYVEAEKNCEKTGGRRSYELSESGRYPNSNCKTADELLSKIEEAEDNVQRLRDEAIDRDIPLEWIQE